MPVCNRSRNPTICEVDVRYWVTFYLLIFWGSAFAVALATMAANNKESLKHELEFLQRRVRIKEVRKSQRSLLHQRTASREGAAGASVGDHVVVAAALTGTTEPKTFTEEEFNEVGFIMSPLRDAQCPQPLSMLPLFVRPCSAVTPLLQRILCK